MVATCGIVVSLTGNPSIDYFVSADVMEGQHRTTLSEDDDTYSEQVTKLTQNLQMIDM